MALLQELSFVARSPERYSSVGKISSVCSRLPLIKMLRSVSWQRSATDAVSWHQDQALNSTIYILREVGPTSFLLKEEGEAKKFKVSLGDPHVCNCAKFRQEKSLCKHICWVLLKRFKLNRNDELSYQLGLVEREVNELLSGTSKKKLQLSNPSGEPPADLEKQQLLEQRPLTEDDVCPICQELLLAKHMPVTYCRHGCGNSVHIKCMKIWADHQQQSTGEREIHCPFCRKEFGSRKLLEQEFRSVQSDSRNPVHKFDCHTGLACCSCNMSPIKGKCYQCMSCTKYHLCNTCYHGHQHMHHKFVYRMKKSQRWRTAPSRNELGSGDLSLSPIARELQNRDITENDYDLLLELDRPNNASGIPVDLAGLPEHLVNRLPLIKVRRGGRFLAPGRQCRLCLRAYVEGQLIRKLPACGHIFHRDCIDKWLKEDHRCCPIDRQLVFDSESDITVPQKKSASHNDADNVITDHSDLVIPGIGLIHLSPSSAIRTTVRPHSNYRLNATNKRNEKESQRQTGGGSNWLTCKGTGSREVTFNDILIEAGTIGAAGSRESRGVYRAEKFTHDVSGENSGWMPVPSARSDGHKDNRKPTPGRKSGPQPVLRSQVPLFPRNREEDFSLSGIKIATPIFDNRVEDVAVPKQPMLVHSCTEEYCFEDIVRRKYSTPLVPDAPATTPTESGSNFEQQFSSDENLFVGAGLAGSRNKTSHATLGGFVAEDIRQTVTAERFARRNKGLKNGKRRSARSRLGS